MAYKTWDNDINYKMDVLSKSFNVLTKFDNIKNLLIYCNDLNTTLGYVHDVTHVSQAI